MKSILVAIVALLTPLAPQFARAAPDSEVAPALQTFWGNAVPDLSQYVQNYRDQLLKGLDGRWYVASILGLQASHPDMAKNECLSRATRTVTTYPPYKFTISQLSGTAEQVNTNYISKNGNLFTVFSDIEKLFAMFDIPSGPAGDSTRSSVLSANGGLAVVIRPSPNVLVIQLNYGPPQILARCD